MLGNKIYNEQGHERQSPDTMQSSMNNAIQHVVYLLSLSISGGNSPPDICTVNSAPQRPLGLLRRLTIHCLSQIKLHTFPLCPQTAGIFRLPTRSSTIT